LIYNVDKLNKTNAIFSKEKIMFVQSLELKLINSEKADFAEEAVLDFAAALLNSGQILPEYTTVKVGQDYKLIVTTPEKDSLEPCFDSIYVKQFREHINELFKTELNLIGINALSQEYCSCQKRTAIEMQTFADDIDSVFTCCDCGKPIPLYRLPYVLGEKEYYWIVNWQKTYKAIDTVWYDSISDRFSGNQLVNVHSELNRRGLDIAEEMAKAKGLTVYYNVFDDFTKKIKFVKQDGRHLRICPSCGKPMEYRKFGDDYERFVCEECKLSSEVPIED